MYIKRVLSAAAPILCIAGVIVACAWLLSWCDSRANENRAARHENTKSKVLEKASIEYRCPLNKIRIVQHYKGVDRYCLNICGEYRWADEILSKTTLENLGESSCGWVVEEKL